MHQPMEMTKDLQLSVELNYSNRFKIDGLKKFLCPFLLCCVFLVALKIIEKGSERFQTDDQCPAAQHSGV